MEEQSSDTADNEADVAMSSVSATGVVQSVDRILSSEGTDDSRRASSSGEPQPSTHGAAVQVARTGDISSMDENTAPDAVSTPHVDQVNIDHIIIVEENQIDETGERGQEEVFDGQQPIIEEADDDGEVRAAASPVPEDEPPHEDVQNGWVMDYDDLPIEDVGDGVNIDLDEDLSLPPMIPGNNVNVVIEDANNDDDSSDDDDFLNRANRRVFISHEQMNEAISELIAQESRENQNQDTFMHRIRRAIFRLERRPRGYSRRRELDEQLREEQQPESQDEPEPENPIRFDTNLPAEHSYMGINMDRVSGVNYLEVARTYKLLLFMHEHILFPGEVLPFMISGFLFDSEIENVDGLLFGVCFPFDDPEGNGKIYGVTCQIYEKGEDSRGNTMIKSRALQRFVTHSDQINGQLQFLVGHPTSKRYGHVKILPEIYLPEPLDCVYMGSMNRFRDIDSMKDVYRRYQASTTPWPAHVYDNYSITNIIEKARTVLAQHKIDTMPTDPTQLSYWLVRNLHLSLDLMKTIFVTDSVNTRLKIISNTFKEDAKFSCRYCGNNVADCRELFAMSKHGVQTQYCNPAGYIHETNTVYHVLPDAISFSGEPSSEFSWFPGYQWHIIICKICARHIGWQFKSLEPNLVPKSFFGISSSSVRITSGGMSSTDPRAVIYRYLHRLARRQMP